MVVAYLATEEGILRALPDPKLSGTVPLKDLKRQSKRGALNSQKGERAKVEKGKEIPVNETQGKMIEKRGSASTSPVETGIANTAMLAASSMKAPKGEEVEVAKGKGTLPCLLPKLTRRRS
jgi:hypothetical protein